MKQKYFVLLFLNVCLIGSVFSQNYYSNHGILKIEAGTDFTIDEVGHKFLNLTDGDIQNEGTINASEGSFRNDKNFSNDGIASLGLTENYLTITNNGSLSVGDFINDALGTYVNNGLLYVQGDYMNDGTIDPSTGTTTFNQTSPTTETIQNMYGTSAFEFYNLVVNNNTSLGVLVADGIGLFVENDLYLQEGNLRLEGESQLIQTKSGVDTNTPGTGVLLRDQQGIASGYGYNYWSSPVNNGSGTYSLNSVLHDGTDSDVNPFSPAPMLYTTAKDGIPSVVTSGNVTTAATVSSQYMYGFYKGAAGEYADWVPMDETTQLDASLGYIMKGTNTTDAQQNYTFKGQPNNGTYSFLVTAGESTLFGNPYPSAFDVRLFLLLGPTLNQLYFWADGGSTSHYLSDYLGGYGTRTAFIGVAGSVIPGEIAGEGSVNSLPAPGRYIAVGQSFFVNAIVSGTLNFTNRDRTFQIEEDNSESTFYKSVKKDEVAQKDELSEMSLIRIGYEDPEGFHRQIALGFLPKSLADKSFNRGYDGIAPGSREDDLFFIIDNKPEIKYVIQGVGAYHEDDVFPLSFTIAEEGVHTIMLDAVENFESDVYIYDKVLDVTYNISEDSFSPNLGIGTYNDRFEIVFKEQKSLGTEDDIISNFNVYFDGNQNLIVKNKNILSLKKLSVFNTLGQQLLQVHNDKLAQSEIAIPFSYKMGVYIVVVESNEGKETFRIINK